VEGFGSGEVGSDEGPLARVRRLARQAAAAAPLAHAPAKVWLWPHVEGSVYAARAGLVPFRLPTQLPDARARPEGAATTFAAAAGGVVEPARSLVEPLASIPGGGSSSSSSSSSSWGGGGGGGIGAALAEPATTPLFLYAKPQAAPAFPPAPLPPPPPPVVKCAVYQRKLPEHADADPDGDTQAVNNS
jgi:hypothetical protein